MSGRFVRASKYRHVHGDAYRKDKCYNGCNVFAGGEGNNVAGNEDFLAYATSGGGGPIVVLKRDKEGVRVGANPHAINVHKANALDWEFNPFISNVIASGGDDCSVAVTQFPTEGLTANIDSAAASLSGHQKKVTNVKWNHSANNILASGSHDGTVRIWDVERQAECLNTVLPDYCLSLEWNYDGSRLATTSRDKKMYLFDPRSQSNMTSVQIMDGTKAAKCFWVPSFNMVGVVGFSSRSVRQIFLFDEKKLDKPVHTMDIDQSAGVILPYYDNDNNILYASGKGDGNIRYYEITNEGIFFLSEFRSTESQKGLCFLPKKACDVLSCEIAHCVRLMRDYLQPVAFIVPRKSELFQEDIFPDTFAGVPALDNSAWLSGKNANPVTMSLKPGAAPQDNKPAAAFVVKKSAAELEKELELANKRIAELEAQVKQLKAK